jgi:hypothetical protein
MSLNTQVNVKTTTISSQPWWPLTWSEPCLIYAQITAWQVLKLITSQACTGRQEDGTGTAIWPISLIATKGYNRLD